MGFYNPKPPPKTEPQKNEQGPYEYGAHGNRWDMETQGNRALGGIRESQENYQGALGHQMGALGMYRDAAMGNGPSQAQAMMQAQGDQNMAQQMQMQAMGRGGNMSGQARAATAAGLASQQQTRQNLGAMAAQEQAAGMAGYAGMGTQMANQESQRQAMYEGSLSNTMDLNQQYTNQQGDFILGLRDDKTKRDRLRMDQNLNWAGFGMNTAGTVFEAIGGAMGGM